MYIRTTHPRLTRLYDRACGMKPGEEAVFTDQRARVRKDVGEALVEKYDHLSVDDDESTTTPGGDADSDEEE